MYNHSPPTLSFLKTSLKLPRSLYPGPCARAGQSGARVPCSRRSRRRVCPSARLPFLLAAAPPPFLQPGVGGRGACGLTWCVGVWGEKSDLRGAPPFAPYRTLLVGPGCLKVPRNPAFSDPEGLPRRPLLRRCVILSFSPQKSIPMRHSGMCVLVHPEEAQISQANSLSGARTPPTPERIQG